MDLQMESPRSLPAPTVRQVGIKCTQDLRGVTIVSAANTNQFLVRKRASTATLASIQTMTLSPLAVRETQHASRVLRGRV